MTTTETTTTDKAATVGAHAAHVAPEKAAANKAATPKKRATKAQKTPRSGKAKAAAAKKAKAGAKASRKSHKPARKTTAPRAESKGAAILAMIGRSKGATLVEIMKATDWQAHSVRGFISTAGKKHRLKIESAQNDSGERTYSVAK